MRVGAFYVHRHGHGTVRIAKLQEEAVMYRWTSGRWSRPGPTRSQRGQWSSREWFLGSFAKMAEQPVSVALSGARYL